MVDDECGAISGLSSRGKWSTRRKPAPVPLFPQQIPHDITWPGFEPRPPQWEASNWAMAQHKLRDTCIANRVEQNVDRSRKRQWWDKLQWKFVWSTYQKEKDFMCCDHRIWFFNITGHTCVEREFWIAFYKTCMYVATSKLSDGASDGGPMNPLDLALHCIMYITRDDYYFMYL
jgi:hypothetical protein